MQPDSALGRDALRLYLTLARKQAYRRFDGAMVSQAGAAGTAFDAIALYEAMEAERIRLGFSWRQVADQLGRSPKSFLSTGAAVRGAGALVATLNRPLAL